MNNPWLELPTEEPPYCLPEDLPIIMKFNQQVEEIHQIRIDGLPEAYIGSIKDPRLVLLNLNPGWSPEDYQHFEHPEFRKAVIQNLHHALDEYPFYHLNPKFNFTGGAKWWGQKLRQLITEVGRETVANHVLVLEYFPYPSFRYKKIPVLLRGQHYTFYLLRKFLKRKNVAIIGMRKVKEWLTVVPELKDKLIKVKNPQNPAISPRNLPDDTFTRIIDFLKR